MVIRILLLTVISLRLSAQQFSPAPFLGMGKAALAQEGIFTLQDNPSGIAHISSLTVSSAYQQHFGNTGISTQAFNFAVPFLSSSVVGLTLVNYGIFDLTSLLRGGISFVRAFGEDVSASLTANYHQYFVKQYQAEDRFSADLGFQYNFSPTFRIGLFWRNIASARFSSYIDQRILQEAGLGALVKVGRELEATADIWYEVPQRITYRTGLVYSFDRFFLLRAGVFSNPTTYTTGVGFRSNHWQIDIASSFHAILGSSPQFSMSYAF